MEGCLTCEEFEEVTHRGMMGLDLVVPNTLISRDSVSGMNPYSKEMLGQTLFSGANPPTLSVSCFSLLENITLSVVSKTRKTMEYSSP